MANDSGAEKACEEAVTGYLSAMKMTSKTTDGA